jgi:hypothetical protein
MRLCLGGPILKRDMHTPLDPGDHPELGTSSFLGAHEKYVYMSMIGAMPWVVVLGHMAILCDVPR